jgi:peptidoglycan/xylan/chitin deacetylase (PgdA/CDA1 family)
VSGIWPGETQCTVMLGFDVDGPSASIFRNPEIERMPSARSMGEFGPNVAVPRILEVLGRRGLPASFYIPGWVAERHPAMVEAVAAAGHEVAHHGYLHEPPASLDGRDAEAEVLDRGSAILEGITGERPLGYRSPSWELSEHSLELLAERGFVYDSSLMGDDIPYVVEERGVSIVEIPVHWSLDDAPYYMFNPAAGRVSLMAQARDVVDGWIDAFDEAYARGRAFTLTLHPWISGRLGRLRQFERLLDHIAAHDHIEVRRAIDVARDVNAGRSTSTDA